MSSVQIPLLLRRRYRTWRLLILVSVFAFGFLCIIVPMAVFKRHSQNFQQSFLSRKLLSDNTTDAGFQYPPDAFDLEQRRDGAVVLHVIGLIYMFVALAIVCDEFFVPALSVIIQRVDISEDVAGATFMAAGGSAPELFTSLIGVFFARNNVGIGTIVGSAVFNILFVIGMCALVSKTVLHLTWWPLFRDVTFYSIDLIVLIVFFRTGTIYWWQALILFLLYLAYVLFMKFNSKIETFVKTKILRRKTRVHSDNNLLNENAFLNRDLEFLYNRKKCCSSSHIEKPHRSCSIPILHSGTSHFRHGVLQLMIHTIDPIAEEPELQELARVSSRKPDHIQDKAMKLHAVAHVDKTNGESQESLANGEVHNGGFHSSPDKNSNQKQMQVTAISNGHTGSANQTEFSTRVVSPAKSTSSPIEEERIQMQSSSTRFSNNTETTNVDSPKSSSDPEGAKSPENEMPDDGDEPLDLSWPSEWRKRITYVLLAPLIFPMWLTLPDTRREEKKKWYPVTFFGSIVWIFIFSYLMVWWANQTGETIGIPNEVMGLTILAAGTSIPDLITSVIVAKKGFGDMAVSSSVGSNIFDITVGLPIPWLLYNAVYAGRPVNVDSNGLACSIVLLFAMLIVVVVVIAASKWKMTKIMGGAMLVLYAVFVVLSVLLELEKIACPVD
ncbi:sodium/potassium/calcium exchanger 2-like isoform X2 [Mercenaria mercenaria]|uniref:sodium/potassium/calcium exchanger 2-like isoform X2 n=1 Tax=Mercenaria mercenaria TaxID=6596 RepID=UPI00234E86B2|nr:sodium/potassium/calcium exchanger 2-like isoform X2 [Mercenaria mercenaria]